MDTVSYEGPTEDQFTDWNEANDHAGDRPEQDEERDEDDAVRMAEWESMVRSRKADPKAPQRWRMDYRWPVSAVAERDVAVEGAQTYRNSDTAYARVREVTRAQDPDRRGPGRVIMTDRRTGEVFYYAIDGRVQVNKMSDDPYGQPEAAGNEPQSESRAVGIGPVAAQAKSPAETRWEAVARAVIHDVPTDQQPKAFQFFLGKIGAMFREHDLIDGERLADALRVAAQFAKQ